MLFSSELNKLAWKIKRATDFTWKESLQLAKRSLIQGVDMEATTSVIGSWTPATQRALAGHFYALKMLSKEAGDEGRSFAFGRISNSLYACYENHGHVSMTDTLHFKNWGASVRQEIIDFFFSAVVDPTFPEHTDRVCALITKTNNNISRITFPAWHF